MGKARELFDRVTGEIRKYKTGRHDDDGREIVSSVPKAPPVNLRRKPTQMEMMRNVVRSELSKRAAQDGLETFEEADDFDIGDDFDPFTPYEVHFDPVEDMSNGVRSDREPGVQAAGGNEGDKPSPELRQPGGVVGGEDPPAPSGKPLGAGPKEEGKSAVGRPGNP